MSSTTLIAIAVAAIAADFVVGTAKAIVSDHVQFSVGMLPKEFLLTMPLATTGLAQLAGLQSALTGGWNAGCTAILVAASGTITVSMLNDIRNKVTSWVRGTPNLSPSTSDFILGVVNKGVDTVENAVHPVTTDAMITPAK